MNKHYKKILKDNKSVSTNWGAYQDTTDPLLFASKEHNIDPYGDINQPLGQDSHTIPLDMTVENDRINPSVAREAINTITGDPYMYTGGLNSKMNANIADLGPDTIPGTYKMPYESSRTINKGVKTPIFDDTDDPIIAYDDINKDVDDAISQNGFKLNDRVDPSMNTEKVNYNLHNRQDPTIETLQHTRLNHLLTEQKKGSANEECKNTRSNHGLFYNLDSRLNESIKNRVDVNINPKKP